MATEQVLLLFVYWHIHATLLYSLTFSKLLFSFTAVLLWLRHNHKSALQRELLLKIILNSQEKTPFFAITLDDCFSLLLIHSRGSHLRVCQTSVMELSAIIQKQPSRGVKLKSSFIEITLRHGCSLVNLLHIFRRLFLRTPLDLCKKLHHIFLTSF